MAKTMKNNAKYSQQPGKTRPLDSEKRMNPLNQSGSHVADAHVKKKVQRRVWPLVNESRKGQKV